MTDIQASELLKILNLGNSVAEFDADLQDYFLETETFRSVIRGERDIVAGDKGTGKTAIYRVLQQNYRSYPELENVEVITAFNPQGNPIFQRLAHGSLLSEGLYQTVWKSYILSLVGNWIIDIYGDSYNDHITKLTSTLEHLDLRSVDTSPETIFGRLVRLLNNLSSPSEIEVAFSVTEYGLPVVVPKVSFGSERKKGDVIHSDEFLTVLDRAAESTELELWVLFDRLDEAFTGFPNVELPALRALFRSYLDLSGLKNIKLKLFVRKDLLRRIVQGGFVNLTHINARRIDIVWEDEDLFNMLVRRVRRNNDFAESTELSAKSDDEVLGILFPPQIDVGERKPTTKSWIASRIRDGNNSKPPRNLIDLANKSKENQSKRK